MHFLSCGMAPLPATADLDISRNPGSQKGVVTWTSPLIALSPINQLMRARARRSSTYLASAILTRGQGIGVSDLEGT